MMLTMEAYRSREINASGFSGLVRPDSTIDGVSLVTSARLWQAVRPLTVVSAAAPSSMRRQNGGCVAPSADWASSRSKEVVKMVLKTQLGFGRYSSMHKARAQECRRLPKTDVCAHSLSTRV